MHLPWVISLLGLCGLASAIDSNGIFSHPPKSGPSLFYLDNIVLTLGDTEELKWSTGMTSYTLTLWQQFLNGGATGDATPILSKEMRGSTFRIVASWRLADFHLCSNPQCVF